MFTLNKGIPFQNRNLVVDHPRLKLCFQVVLMETYTYFVIKDGRFCIAICAIT